MLDIVEERHCKRHPLTDAWARGELSREQIGRWAVGHWHYTHDLHRLIGRILANCDQQEGRNITGMPTPGGPQLGTRETCAWIAAAGVVDGRPNTIVDYIDVWASPVGNAFAYCDQVG